MKNFVKAISKFETFKPVAHNNSVFFKTLISVDVYFDIAVLQNGYFFYVMLFYLYNLCIPMMRYKLKCKVNSA